MPETLSPLFPHAQVSVILEIVPSEDEEDDLDTLAVVRRVQADVRHEVAQLEAYSVNPLPMSEPEQGARGVDIVLLITFIGASLAAYKDLLTSIFQTISTVVEVLAKRGQVQEIEIIVDGKTLILRDVSKKTARELIEAFSTQHPEAVAKLIPQKTVQVKARVSKKKNRAK